jgi:hypothetical protein
MSKELTVIVPLEPENPDGYDSITMTATENLNFVSLEIGGHYYDVAIADLYRATMPFMDYRQELISQN